MKKMPGIGLLLLVTCASPCLAQGPSDDVGQMEAPSFKEFKLVGRRVLSGSVEQSLASFLQQHPSIELPWSIDEFGQLQLNGDSRVGTRLSGKFESVVTFNVAELVKQAIRAAILNDSETLSRTVENLQDPSFWVLLAAYTAATGGADSFAEENIGLEDSPYRAYIGATAGTGSLLGLSGRLTYKNLFYTTASYFAANLLLRQFTAPLLRMIRVPNIPTAVVSLTFALLVGDRIELLMQKILDNAIRTPYPVTPQSAGGVDDRIRAVWEFQKKYKRENSK